MKRYWSLIKKDLLIHAKDPIGFLFFLGFPIIYLVAFSFMMKVVHKDLTIDVDKNLAYKFNNQDTILVDYLGEKVKLALNYRSKESLLKDFEKERIPAIYYSENGENILYVNINKTKGATVYKFLDSYFSIRKKDSFVLKKKQNFNFALLNMVLNFFIVFGSITLASSSLADEIKKQNILLLLKSGLSYCSILVSKLLFTLVLQILLFFIFYLFCSFSGLLDINLNFFLYLPLIIVPTAMVGIFLSSISTKSNITLPIMMLLWFPSMFYPLVKDNLNSVVKFLLQFDPLILVTDFIEQAFRNDINLETVVYIVISTIVFFIISMLFVKKTTLKNS